MARRRSSDRQRRARELGRRRRDQRWPAVRRASAGRRPIQRRCDRPRAVAERTLRLTTSCSTSRKTHSWPPSSGRPFTAYTYWEISTENRVTNYQNAPIFHADFTATGTWGKWTVGPVATYFTEVGHDSSSPFYAVGIGSKPAECIGPIGFECLDGPQNFWQVSVGGLHSSILGHRYCCLSCQWSISGEQHVRFPRCHPRSGRLELGLHCMVPGQLRAVDAARGAGCTEATSNLQVSRIDIIRLLGAAEFRGACFFGCGVRLPCRAANSAESSRYIARAADNSGAMRYQGSLHQPLGAHVWMSLWAPNDRVLGF
jgi:hypothetical protein